MVDTLLHELLEPSSSAEFRATLCRDSFADFVREFWECVPGAGKVIWNWHMDVFCDEFQVAMERVFAGLPREYDLGFNVPFGTSKSTVLSVLSQAWAWSRMPPCRFLSGTHTDSLALDLAGKAKDVVASEKYRRMFPDVLMRRDKAARDDYANTAGGERKSCTVGGKTPTGRHSHVIIIDDPVDPQGVRSEAMLETAARFMTEVLPSRKVDKLVSLTVLVMQRLDYRDPTAVMVRAAAQEGVVPFRLVCLPGELTEDVYPPLEELRARYGDHVYAEDGLLDPRRLPRVVLVDYRKRMGEYAYAGQVLQKPVPPGGGMFKPQWFNQRVRAAPYQAKRVRFWDRASTADGGCYSAGVLLAKDGDGNYYVEDCVHGQWEPDERNARIKATALRDRSRYGPKYAPVIVVESEGGSTGVDANKMLARVLAGFVVRFDRPSGSKDVRAEPWASQLAAGNVYLVEDPKWPWDLAGYVQEHLLFRPEIGKRLGKYKDQVDASAAAFLQLIGPAESGPKFRVLSHRDPNQKHKLRLIACSYEALRITIIEEKSLLICIRDYETDAKESEVCHVTTTTPLNNNSDERTVGATVRMTVNSEEVSYEQQLSTTSGDSAAGGEPLPPHGLNGLLASLTLAFDDLDPAKHQEDWTEELATRKFRPEQAKKLWRFLGRKRDPVPQAIVFTSSGGRRALSLAYAAADVLNLPRSQVYDADDPESKCEGSSPLPFVYDQAKAGKSMVL